MTAMRNLLRANFSRMGKSKIFWTEVLFMMGLAAFVVWNQYDEMTNYGATVTMDHALFLGMSLFGVVAAVFVSLLIGVEYSDGTIRNKLVVGWERTSIYLANYIVSMVGAVIAYTLSVLTALVLSLMLFDPPACPVPTLFAAFGIGIAMCLTYAALYNLIAMVCSSKTHTAIICILLAFALMIAATYHDNKLRQPEFVQQLAPIVESVDEDTEITATVTSDGELDQMALETVPNPNYITGAERERCQFLYELNPTGQALQIATLEFLHPVRIILYDIGIMLLSCLGGILVFRRKDIK